MIEAKRRQIPAETGARFRKNACRKWLLGGDRFNHYELAQRSSILEDDASADLREERVVFASADIQARLYASAALPHDDGAAGDDLPAEGLESQPLRVGIAPIT